MKILLHIGQSKTGTSAIQAYLTLNREKLRENRILYPAAKIRGMPVNLGSHNSVADALAGKSRFPSLSADEYFEQFFNEAKKINAAMMILSAEHFFAGEPRTWDVPEEGEYLQRYEQKIKNLANYLKGHEVSVLAYLRPQVDWLASAVSQNVRTDRLVSDNQLYRDDQQFFDLLKPLLRYSTLLEIWERVLNPVTITVIPYCRKTLYKNSSIADFLYRAGLLDIKFLYASDEIQVNESLTIEYIEVKKIINKRPRSKTRERVIIRCLENLSKSSTKGTRYELALSVQRDIEAYVEKDNETLNRRYGSREFKFLARAQSGNTVCVGVSNKDVEQALKSFEREYRRPYYVMLWIIYAASALLRRHAKPVHAVIHQLKMFLHNWRFKNS